MPQNAYIFNQLHSLLPRDHFEYLVKKYDGNAYIKIQLLEPFLVMLWAQLSGRESLRDIESSLRAHRDKLYRLGMGMDISRNNISYANATREVAIFREFAQRVMDMSFGHIKADVSLLSSLSEGCRLSGFFAVDSSTVYLNRDRFGWSVPQKDRGGVKLHTLYDILREIPAMCLITGHEERDQTFMEDYPYRRGGMYVFDKAYVKTSCLRRINEVPAFFVVRRKRGMAYSVLSEQAGIEAPVYGDKEILFTNRWAGKGYSGKLRLVQYYSRERNEVMDFLTNNFMIPAAMIAQAYRYRWNIEMFSSG